MSAEVLVSIGASLIAIAFGLYLTAYILRQPAGDRRMQEISNAIREGANAYLNRQYKTIFLFVLILALIFAAIFNIFIALTFLFGALFSAAAGYIGMYVAMRANVRTAEAAKKGLMPALEIAFSGGNVMGLAVVGLGLLGISVFYLLFNDPSLIVGFGFGASFVALFARLGGGIYTKAADVGADLVGKVEKGIPEDDPRNPAVIADNVGDNVGDVAGMGADLFESFCASIIAAMVIGFSLGAKETILPLLFAAAGVISMIIGKHFIGSDRNPQKAINQSILFSSLIGIILFFLISYFYYQDLSIFLIALIGVFVMLAIGFITQYYTSYDYNPTKMIAESSQTGTGTNILAGFANGLMSTVLPIIVISIAIILSYWIGGIYGIALAAVSMLSLAGLAIAIDSCGAISDNAGGIVEMSKVGKEARGVTDKLDAAGNTAAAIAKGAAIGSAALTVLALFVAFFHTTGLSSIDISKSYVLVGLFLGGITPFLFSSLAISAVQRAAFKMVEEVRRQFKEIKGLMAGKAKPDYARCVDISTQAALGEMITPSLIVVITPLLIGFIFGAEPLAAFLAGATLTGVLLAIFMTSGGASWDNAKKYIEEGHFGGKGSEPHKAAVIGDTVGDPLKDTAGPSLNILIKLMSTISLLFASLFVSSLI
ncbi:MAG: sodium-translocating pyrophosphatase [Candidatus Micrarchaeota archaeon]|nr:sodium-translocating pyrophosphatase [Candidatus Micrarchaeota archaeon]